MHPIIVVLISALLLIAAFLFGLAIIHRGRGLFRRAESAFMGLHLLAIAAMLLWPELASQIVALAFVFAAAGVLSGRVARNKEKKTPQSS